MPWYGWLILACVIIGPFDALYMYIKAQRRREAYRRKKAEGAVEAPSEDRKTDS